MCASISIVEWPLHETPPAITEEAVNGNLELLTFGVRHISDRVGVMYLGRLVETAPIEALFANPRHPCTQILLGAVPVPDLSSNPPVSSPYSLARCRAPAIRRRTAPPIFAAPRRHTSTGNRVRKRRAGANGAGGLPFGWAVKGRIVVVGSILRLGGSTPSVS